MRPTLNTAGLNILVWLVLLSVQAFSQITYYTDVPYANKLPGDPTYSETTLNIFYPDGGCPALPGCASGLRPVAILLRGGNSNDPNDVGALQSPIAYPLLQQGFVVVVPNFHVIDTQNGENYLTAVADSARVIQWVRYYYDTLNIDPERLVCMGHSGGAIHAYRLGLNTDYQNVNSTDPVETVSSRPNAIVAWGTPSDLNCMNKDAPELNPSFVSSFFFGQPYFSQASATTKTLGSPIYWLQNPALYGRTVTPPICVAGNLSAQSPCGQIVDTHDGKWATIMMETMQQYAANDPAWLASCALVDIGVNYDAAIQEIVNWMVASVAPPPLPLTIYTDIPYTDKSPADPTYSETTLHLIYPGGLLPGSASAPRPLVVILRAGNTNDPAEYGSLMSPIAFPLAEKGYVLAILNFHIVDTAHGESYLTAVDDIAQAIQFLRYYSDVLRINPDKVVVMGHGAGGLETYYLSLNRDYRDFNSTNPVRWMSSRPDASIIWGAPCDMGCMAADNPVLNPSFLSSLFFGTPYFSQITTAQKVNNSANFWLLNPTLFNRTTTPPLCVISDLQNQTPCGQIVEAHDGKFGPLMLEAIQQFGTQQAGQAYVNSCALIDMSLPIDTLMNAIITWTVQTFPPIGP